ncbi:probable DnaJ protein homolog 2 at C-terminar half [Coccomyxa sp. Obi]|nr:probable DnaJ protein homolog 2 at C-terminar half [Coccomyxa sp. Obi]
MHPGNVKAYYRKGVALLQLQRAAEAVAVLRLGVLLAPKSKQLAKCLEEAETCTRNGFQLDRKADTDTARQVRSEEVQSRGWYRGTCDTGASNGAASSEDTAPESTELQAYLGILKIEADSSPATIRQAYLKRAVEEHPDKGGSAEAFVQVHAAYRALCMRAVP